MKKYTYNLYAAIASTLITACGVSNNISFITEPGKCPNNVESAPYCMGVTVSNNSGGQNFINSTNYPINNLSLTLIGESNIIDPTTNNYYDPNKCLQGSVAPGSSCKFYLKISSEAHPVTSSETINLNLNYSVQNNLFGNNSNLYSKSTNIYEFTNLYILEQASNSNNTNYNLWQYNAKGLKNVGLIESSDIIHSMNVDTSNFGYVYLGGSSGVYQYGNGLTSPSITGKTTINANNLITSSNNLYITNNNSSNYGIWSYNLTNSTLSSSPTFSSTTTFLPNTYTINGANWIYLVGTTNDQPSKLIYICNNSNLNNGNCTSYTNAILTDTTINSLGFSNAVGSLYTGIFIGTSNGLQTENGSPSQIGSSWTPVQGVPTTSSIQAIVSDKSGNIYASDNQGQIYKVDPSNPISATTLLTPSLGGMIITNLIIDKFANQLYFIAKNTTTSSYSLYSFSLGGTAKSATLVGSLGDAPVIGMAIASNLSSTQ